MRDALDDKKYIEAEALAEQILANKRMTNKYKRLANDVIQLVKQCYRQGDENIQRYQDSRVPTACHSGDELS